MGESEAPGGVEGGGVFIENPRRGGGRGMGLMGPGGCLRRIGEFFGAGGLNIFFRGRNVHQERLNRTLKRTPFLASKKVL